MDRDEVGREGPMARSEEAAMGERDVSIWAVSIHLAGALTTLRTFCSEHGDECNDPRLLLLIAKVLDLVLVSR